MDASRRMSMSTDRSGGPAPSLSVAHRRMSRMVDPALMAGRRMSTFRRLSLAGSHRTDLSHLSSAVPIKFQNTYRLEPEEEDKFQPARVQRVIRSVLSNFLQEEEYEAHKCATLSQSISDVLKGRVKDMGFTRYKIVCTVIIGEKGSQSMECASRCLWSTNTDNCAISSYENKSLFAVGAVYGVYFE